MRNEPSESIRREPSRRRRWLRRSMVAICVIAALPFLARLALELPQVRGAIFRLAAERVRDATSLELSAGDWRVSLLDRRLLVDRLALRDAQGRDVATAASVNAVVDGSALLGGLLVLERLDVVEPRLDLTLWPELPERAPTPEPGGPLEVRRLRIRGGAVAGGALPEDAAGWIASWRARDLEVEGALRDGSLELGLSAALEVEGERIGERTLTVALEQVSGPTSGPWRLDGLEVRGDGLALEVPGAELGIRPEDPLRASVRLAADLGRLAPELAGRAHGEGELDLRRWRGRVRLEAAGLPGELLEPWLGRELFTRLGAAGSSLEADVDLDLASDDAETVAGDARLRWLGARGPLLEAAARLTGGGVDAQGALDWESLEGELEIAADDLPAETLRPFLGAERFSQLALAGALIDLEGEATARASDLLEGSDSGGTGGLRATLRGELEQEGERWITLRAATTTPPAGSGSGAIAGGAIAIDLAAELWPELSGERRVTGTVWAPSRSQIAQLELLGVSASVAAPELGELHDALEARVPQLLEELPETIDRRLLRDLLRGSAAARVELAGAWRTPDVVAEVEWRPAPGSAVELDASGRVATPIAGEVELRLVDLDLAPFAALMAQRSGGADDADGDGEVSADMLAGVVSGTAVLEGTLEEPHGSVRLRATGLVLASDVEPIDEVVLDASLGGIARAGGPSPPADGRPRRIEVSRLEVFAPAGRLAASGWFEPHLPLGAAAATLEVSAPDSGLERVLLDLEVDAGVMRIDSRELLTRAGAGEIAAVVPLRSLRRLEGLPELADRVLPPLAPDETAPAVEVRVRVPELTDEGLATMLETTLETTLEPTVELPQELPRFALQDLALDARLDLARPAAADANLRLGGLQVETLDPGDGEVSAKATLSHTLRLTQPLEASLRDGELSVRGVSIAVDDHALLVDASATLATGWSPGDPVDDLVRDLRAEARGALPAAALDPFLAGGVARGLLDLRAEVAGPLDALTGVVRIDGTGVSVLYRAPYLTRITDPVLELEIRDGRALLRSGAATLNEGPVTLAGEIAPDSGIDLRAEFSDLRYRLDYGLSVELAGDLRLQWPLEPADAPEGPPAPGRARSPLLSGAVRVERGLVRRDVDLEREVLAVLRGIEAEEATDLARQLALDLQVTTAGGVRVRNNVADLRVRWSPIQVRGTLAEPVLEGTVEVDPGGTVFAYGQRARVDRGLLRFPGRPGAEPQLALDVTTALEDPSLMQAESSSLDPFAGSDLSAGDLAGEGPAAEEVLAAGFAEYFGGRLAAGLGRGLGESVRVSLRPIGLLNESDPDARLTIGRDLNRYLTLGLALNLRQAEQRTYLLDAREVPRAPRMVGQAFTNEAGNEGVTVQQSLELGGGGDPDEEPRLRRLRIEIAGIEIGDRYRTDRYLSPISRAAEGATAGGTGAGGGPPGEVGEAAVRRAIALRPGDRVYDGALFDTEIEAIDALVRQGFSDPRVMVTTRAARRGAVDLLVEIEPGPRAQVAFIGDPLPARSRAAIAMLYRSDSYEPAALEEMARATEAVLRGQGFLDPTATARVAPDATRAVIVEAVGGRRVALDRIEWRGLGEEAIAEEAVARLDAAFAGTRSRVELAIGRPAADASVRQALTALGYLDATIVGRSLADDGERLVVELDTGPLVRVSQVSMRGAPEDQAPPLLDAGVALSGDLIADAAFALEEDLRASGRLDARVAIEVERIAEREADVTFEVAPGERYRLGEVEVAGLGATSPALVRRLVGSSPGDLLGEPELDEARAALFESGLFTSVAVAPQRGEGSDPARAQLGIEVEEAPRFQLGYGLRYETDVGLGVVVDAVDRNVAGWGLQLGARLLHRSDDQRARLWFASPRLAGSRLTLEGFAQVAEEILDEGEELETRIDSFDSGLQLSRPLGARSRAGAYARFREETFSFDDPFFGPFEETLRFPVLGVQYLYRGVQDPFQRASRGLWASIDLSGSDDAIGGQLRFVRLFGQVGLVSSPLRVAGRTVDWAQLYRVGVADAFDQDLVRAERFFAGGAFSVRGYPREGIGPFESLGDFERALGGEALFVVNQELRFPIAGDFGGVLFIDAGNVWESVDGFGDDLLVGVGAGARWQSPIGLLRLDLAAPLDRREGEKKLWVYFGFGHVF
ncbi:MAG TPA: translocation/assembly module TamB domain-containing protein [Thermoanaerobaculia bacterium]|nr:translocation/assembly module TamB domain-containing protein [Thermoanaerobaculia bacterium]